jgi:possible phosphoglycerate mutase
VSASRVVLWRHGQTDLNIAGRIQGSLDVPLNDSGRSQAQAAAAVLAEYSPSLVVSSPLARAHSTAQALAHSLDLDVAVDDRLVERDFGRWEGLDRDAIRSGWPEQFATWTSGGQPEGLGVETRAAVGERVSAAIDEWAGRAEGTVVVVAHGSGPPGGGGGGTGGVGPPGPALGGGGGALLGMDPENWFGLRGMDNCHWAILASQVGRHPAWRINAYNLGAKA